MSSSGEESQAARSATEREIHEILSRARAAWGLYQQAQIEAADGGSDPAHHPRVRDRHRDLHTYTIQAFSTMRAEIRRHLDEHWTGEAPHGEKPPEPIYQSEQGNISYFKDLDAWEPGVIRRTKKVSRRNQPDKQETVVQPKLLPPAACKAILDRLGECRVEMGLGADIEADLQEWGYFNVSDEELPAEFDDWFEFAENEDSEAARNFYDE